MVTSSVVIVVSGPGRVRRGSETWATERAGSMSESGVDVRAYGVGPVETRVRYEVLRRPGPRSSPMPGDISNQSSRARALVGLPANSVAFSSLAKDFRFLWLPSYQTTE